MNTSFSHSFLVCTVAFTLGGCAAQSTFEQENESQIDEALSTKTQSFVSIRKDTRKCLSPLCGGYFVKTLNQPSTEQNQSSTEKYVSKLDFSKSGLDEITVDKVLSAPEQEIVLFGKLGPKEHSFKTRPFMVSDAYRGMPGVVPTRHAEFYQAKDRSPQISCFTAPCPNEIATKLNTAETKAFDSFNVKRAAKPLVDQGWLTERVRSHDAVVAGRLVRGQRFPGGYETVLKISQVFVRLPDMVGPCPMMPIPDCGPLTATFTRSTDRCLIFEACVDQSQCPMIKPARCAEGYSHTAWKSNTAMCTEFVCEPSFLIDEPEPEPGFCATARCRSGYHCSDELRTCLPDQGFDASLLAGDWEAIAMADSGHPAEPVPPGVFQVFRADGTLAMGCGDSDPAGTWTIDPTGMTIQVELGGGSVQLNWAIASLSDEELAFGEGGDIFYYRRSTCP